MNNFMLRCFLIFGLLFSCSISIRVLAEPSADDLKKIKTDINNTKANIKLSEKQHDDASTELAKLETSLGAIQKQKQALSRAIKEQEKELSSLKTEERKLEEARAAQEKLLAEQLNASYRLGHEKNIKMLLNQEDSKAVSRTMAYSNYLTKSRVLLLESYKTTLSALEATRQDIIQKTQLLSINQATLAAQESAIQSTAVERSQLMSKLKQAISSDKQKVVQLQSNQQQLQQLLNKLRLKEEAKLAEEQAYKAKAQAEAEMAKQHNEEAPIQKPVLANNKGFNLNKGKLPWPTRGKMVNLFGQSRQNSAMRWQGLRFIAAEGTPIYSVYSGKVVFAEWFRGKGLLMIIDHGGGYMTLYAHNQSLIKDVGDTVKTGETIAIMGNSGGLPSPELYFELRLKGEPLNPSTWLSRNNG